MKCNELGIGADEVNSLMKSSRLIVRADEETGGSWISIKDIPHVGCYGMALVPEFGALFVRVESSFDDLVEDHRSISQTMYLGIEKIVMQLDMHVVDFNLLQMNTLAFKYQRHRVVGF